MAWLNTPDRRFLEAVAAMAFCNPFLPERLEHERRALGRVTAEGRAVWAHRAGQADTRPEVVELGDRLAQVLDRAADRLSHPRTRPTPDELALYEDAALYLLYDRYHDRMQQSIQRGGTPKLTYWPAFAAEFDRYLRPPGITLPSEYEPAHVLACYFQIRRAFHGIFHRILGGSPSSAQLRAATWQSIFTHDLRAYYRGVFRHMADFTTLIVGPSGTGKELVARAIAGARYMPFDAERARFTDDPAGLFHPINLAALPTTLIESELFGHARGAFTGAVADRVGYLEACPPHGTVFLDEIGDLDPLVQVKLLRVLQERQFTRVGDTRALHFAGKIIAATHRDLTTLIDLGLFREDFFYRLCSDVIRTPPLAEVIAGNAEDLTVLVRFLAGRAVDEDAQAADLLTERTLAWIDRHLGRDYAWPGNIRELEQCIRGILIRGHYVPRSAQPETPMIDAPALALAAELCDATLTAEQVLARYVKLVYGKTGSYIAAANVLQLDRRTVRRYVEAVP